MPLCVSVCVKASAAPALQLANVVRSGLQHVLEQLAAACPAYPLIRCVSPGDWLGRRVGRPDLSPAAAPSPSSSSSSRRGGTLKLLRERASLTLSLLIPR